MKQIRVYWCRACKKDKIRRTYIRDNVFDTPNGQANKRGFKAIGWYCLKCKRFISHELAQEEENKSLAEFAKIMKQTKSKG